MGKLGGKPGEKYEVNWDSIGIVISLYVCEQYTESLGAYFVFCKVKCTIFIFCGAGIRDKQCQEGFKQEISPALHLESLVFLCSSQP